MLSRVANSLYWMGRYLERTEHLARYLNVQYFSTLDAPMSQKKHFVLKSIMNMVGVPEEENTDELEEEEVLFKVALDQENTYSLIASVTQGRENARGIRSVISTELWESINKYYHFVHNYPVDVYKTRGLYDFCINAIQHCAVIRANVDNTLIHDNVHAMILLGIHLERAAQITRILSSKLYDIFSITEGESNLPLESYQWTITLKALEAFDMSHRFYTFSPNQQSICEFLIMNKDFPRSIAFNIDKVQDFLNYISRKNDYDPDSLGFYLGRMAGYYKYLMYEDISSDLQGFLTQTLENIYHMHTLLMKEYLA